MKNTILLLILISFLFSCNKHELANEEVLVTTGKLSESEVIAINDVMEKLPVLIRYMDEERRPIEFDVRSGEHHIVKDNGRWDFANPASSQIVFSSSNVVIYLSSPPGLNASPTYTVNAGNTSLNVYTYCLAAQYSIATPFTMPINGISFVLGIDGSAGLFGGVAVYAVYDSPASGNYTSIDWQNYTGTSFGPSSGISYVFSYSSTQVDYYLSKNGSINVNNGDMTFSGDYYYLPMNYYAITQGMNYTIVSGSGTMGCL